MRKTPDLCINLELIILGKGRSGTPHKQPRKRLISTELSLHYLITERRISKSMEASPNSPKTDSRAPAGERRPLLALPALLPQRGRARPGPGRGRLTSGTPGNRSRPPRRREESSAAPWPSGKREAVRASGLQRSQNCPPRPAAPRPAPRLAPPEDRGDGAGRARFHLHAHAGARNPLSASTGPPHVRCSSPPSADLADLLPSLAGLLVK